jgi:uncharacterized protein (DUF3820 family)
MKKMNKSPFDFEEDEFLKSKIKFGKYRGQLWIDVVSNDPRYIEWLINNVEFMTEAEKKTLSEAIELLND